MNQPGLQPFNLAPAAKRTELNGVPVPAVYGAPDAEFMALTKTAGVLDLSSRGRLCLTGADRARFLHGQVTNDIRRLQPGQGCYAALVTAKGRMQSDLNILCLPDEVLLDFEPGYATTIIERLERFIVADDVQVVDVAAAYGLLSVQGPRAAEVMRAAAPPLEFPGAVFANVKWADPLLGEMYVVNLPRTGTAGFDVFAPIASMPQLAKLLLGSAEPLGGCACGWEAFETARIAAAIPRFGADMDETCFPQECGIESRAVSYSKGCYIGQEILNRIHAMGHVNRHLCALRFPSNPTLLAKGEKLFRNGKEVGLATSVAHPPGSGTVGLGYVRKEAADVGTELQAGQSQTPCVITQVTGSTAGS